MNEFETAVVNAQSVFEPLKVYCNQRFKPYTRVCIYIKNEHLTYTCNARDNSY